MKNIILIGASGFIGSAILKEALDRGHKVTGVVRHPEKITLVHNNLVVRQSDVSVPGVVEGFDKNADAVISAYNPGWTNPDIAPLTTSVYRTIINGVKKAGIKRLMIVGGAGSLFLSTGKRMMDSGMIPDSYLPAVKALADIYLVDLASENELDWIFFSPAVAIQPGLRTGKFRIGKDDALFDEKGESNISVQDYAVAMIDELENPSHHRERFTIGY
jgi:putative NADH-flavin reductase